MVCSNTLLALLALTGSVVASPLGSRANHKSDDHKASTTTAPPAPAATIWPESMGGKSVVFSGSNGNGIDSYWGIPFAAPPVGDLRFAKPQTYDWTNATFDATHKPPACLQAERAIYTGEGTGGMSEDCLYLNVQVPEGTNSNSKKLLPVMVWVYGGGFTSGSSAFYDGSIILTQAGLDQKPVVYVSVNYRMGVFGFANGKEAAEAGAANLGLRDVQKSLEWVKDHIHAFGGDPDKVTVFGQSAGSILISDLYLQPNMSLFKGAIMHSGAQSTAPIARTDVIWQEPYDYLVEYAGCNVSTTTDSSTPAYVPSTPAYNSSTYNSSTPAYNSSTPAYNMPVGCPAYIPSTPADNSSTPAYNSSTPAYNSSTPADTSSTPAFTSSIECLKSLSADKLIAAQNKVLNMPKYQVSFPFAPSVDGDLIPDSPHKLLQEGRFARIPYISGSVKDEGTYFIPTKGFNLSDPATVALGLSSLEPNGLPSDILDKILNELYPNYPVFGSPFDTGDQTFGLPPAFKQMAAILSDSAFQAPRRWFQTQSVANGFDKVWSYLWDITAPSTEKYLGTPHAADVFYVFGLPQLATSGIKFDAAVTKGLASYKFTSEDSAFSWDLIDHWLNFAYYTDPNGADGKAAEGALFWPKYGAEGNMLATNRSETKIIPDTYRKTQMDYLLSNPVAFNYKRQELGQ